MQFVAASDGPEEKVSLKRSNSLSKLHDSEEYKNSRINGHDKSVHRFHSPQMGRKSYVKPPKPPKKPHGLKLEIPKQSVKVAIDSGIHSWSGTPSTKSKSSTPSTGLSLDTPLTTSTSLSLSGKPSVKPSPFENGFKSGSHESDKKVQAPVPAKRHFINSTTLAAENQSSLPKIEDNSKSTNLTSNGVKPHPQPKKRIGHSKSLGANDCHGQLATSCSLDDPVLPNASPKIALTEENNSGDQLTPKRKAPRPPHARHIRRKSDTLVHVVNRPNPAPIGKHRRVTTANGFSYHVKTQDITGWVKNGSTDPGNNGDIILSKHRYYTPQPTRKFATFSLGDSPLLERGHYGVPPVERMAIQRQKSGHTSKPLNVSPERNKRVPIPISPLASPVRDNLVQLSGGKTMTPPPLKANRQNHSASETIEEENEEEEEDMILEVSDSSSFEGFVMVNKKPNKKSKHRSLPAQISQRARTSSQDALAGVQHHKSSKVRRRKARGHSVPLGRIKSTNVNAGLPSLSASSSSRTSPERKRGDLRETLLREALQRQVSRSAVSNTNSHPKSTNSNSIGLHQTNTKPPLSTSHHKSHHKQRVGEDETDFASKEDFVDSVSAYSLNSPGNSPQHRRRRRSSGSSMFSIPESLLGTAAIFREIFMSERSSHRKIKALVGFVFGIILGICLYMVLDFALEYEWKAALIITSVASLFMAVSLALTVRARCVAALMFPTLCTSKGRAAIYAIIIGLLLAGPIQNIYINAEVTSQSMSCSAEMAVNHSRALQQASQEVLDSYVRALVNSVVKLQEAVSTVNEIFQPIDEGINLIQGGLQNVADVLQDAATICDEIIGSAYKDCRDTLSMAYEDCKQALTGTPKISQVCEVLNAAEACELLNLGGVCQFPSTIDTFIDNTIGNMLDSIENLRQMLVVDVDFSTYWDNRQKLNGSIKAIQKAVKEDLQSTHDIIMKIFSVSDKILALSLLWLAIRSYGYYWKFCTKDKFDNFYITPAFKKMDEHRKSEGKQHLLPLKKSERRHYVDLSSLRLCKPERGLFKIGLATVFMHATIAALIIVVDYGFYFLLALIREHGQFQYNFETEGATDFDIGGTGIMSQLVRWMFSEGFNVANSFNLTIDTNECLPTPSQPHRNTAIAVGVLYIFTLLTVLCQAYMLRLRRFIASYYYPEREIERTLYLYNETLNRRNNLFRLLRRYMKQNKKEMDYQNSVSINAYLMRTYPCWGKFMKTLGFYNKYCQGCRDKDIHGNFKRCSSKACECIYCFECAREAEYVCACNEFLDDYAYKSAESKC
ncbi:DC-STAMP domain-containing protein 2 [Holothuria leucospilota]|uniref:DC-STAMP domain-containing protein 2 n=1 Tax=Holothuria leucospilota TaxID=206669 RepID=A0A9Q1CCB5_HOLLE|nr:DC-STAMP domain-containing protein 2 [Holothuria leucospilota]